MSTQLRFPKTTMNYRRINNKQTAFPARNVIGIINNFVVRSLRSEKLPCERRHKHAVFTHASPLLKATTLSQITLLSKPKKQLLHYFSSNGKSNKSQKEHRKSTTRFTVLSHLSWSCKINFNPAIRFQSFSCIVDLFLYIHSFVL